MGMLDITLNYDHPVYAMNARNGTCVRVEEARTGDVVVSTEIADIPIRIRVVLRLMPDFQSWYEAVFGNKEIPLGDDDRILFDSAVTCCAKHQELGYDDGGMCFGAPHN
jgi:hypothetical protein